MPLVFKKQLSMLKTEHLGEHIEKIMLSLDDYNCVGAASSSGKYHPESDNGIAGNVNHSLNVLYFILRLAESIPQFDDDSERDILICSAILHDMCKYSSKNYSHTDFEHPKLIHDAIEKYMYDFGSNINNENLQILSRVSNSVYCHMSRWNTSQKSETVLPTPSKMEHLLLSFADIIAADKNVHLDRSNVKYL